MSSIVWDLPFGTGRPHQPRGILGALANDWTLTNLVTLQSGMPIAVTQTTNFNAFAGFGVQRPNLVGDPTLPADQRLTFTMHYYSGLPLSEVALAMDTSLPTCKSRLRLAREKLRQKLRERGMAMRESIASAHSDTADSEVEAG